MIIRPFASFFELVASLAFVVKADRMAVALLGSRSGPAAEEGRVPTPDS